MGSARFIWADPTLPLAPQLLGCACHHQGTRTCVISCLSTGWAPELCRSETDPHAVTYPIASSQRLHGRVSGALPHHVLARSCTSFLPGAHPVAGLMGQGQGLGHCPCVPAVPIGALYTLHPALPGALIEAWVNRPAKNKTMPWVLSDYWSVNGSLRTSHWQRWGSTAKFRHHLISNIVRTQLTSLSSL